MYTMDSTTFLENLFKIVAKFHGPKYRGTKKKYGVGGNTTNFKKMKEKNPENYSLKPQ